MKTRIAQITLTIFIFGSLFIVPAQAQSEVEEIEVTTEEKRMVTFLGVETSRISNALRNHIDLPEGVGLTISHIAKDSGAADADLQQYDILHKVDDQIIINQEQLKTYVRSKSAGEKVRLEILRKGETLRIPVTLSEREEQKHTPFGNNWSFPNPIPSPFPNGGQDWNFNFNSEEFQKHMEEFSKHAAEIGNRAMQFIPEVMIEREEDDGSKRTTTIGRGPNKVIIRKNNLEAEMTTNEGKRSYVIKRKDSDKESIIYEEKEPSEEQLKELSDDVQALIKRLNEAKSFDWTNIDEIKKENIRVIINTGEDEANISNQLDDKEEV